MKNIELIKGAFIPREKIGYARGSVVSQQLVSGSAGNITLFSFDEGQQLSEHTAPFDAVCQILEGKAEIHVARDVYQMSEGEMIIMPANVPHALYAVESFKMMLIMIKGQPA